MAETGHVGAEPKKTMHPFFSMPASSTSREQIPRAAQPVTPDPSCSPASDQTLENPDVPAAADADENVSGLGPRKRRKTEPSAAPKQQPRKRGRPPKARVSAGSNITSHLVQVNGDDSVDASEAGGPHKAAHGTEKAPTAHNEPTVPLGKLPQPSLNTDTAGVDKPQTETLDVKPKKLLIFNPKTGTIGSPPKPKAQVASLGDDKLAKSATAKSRRGKKTASLVVSITYGKDDPTRTRIGEKIEEIYSGVRYVSPSVTLPPAVQPKTTTKATRQKTLPASGPQTPKMTTSKATHPFFSSKPKSGTATAEAQDNSKPPPKKQSVFTSTPCSPKHVRQPLARFNVPQFGMKSGGFKFPGAQHPAWPWKGMVHIRGDERDVDLSQGSMASLVSLNHRKAKGRVIELPADESILTHTVVRLNLGRLSQELKDLDTEEFLPPPPSLRVPERHFESGKKLQQLITPELRTLTTAGRIRGHPAIIHTYNSLVASLSAFDRSTCETISWTQKHAPTSADQVLQDGREAEMLRDWLLTLKIQSVDTGASNPAKPKSEPVAKKKKRRKLDDFVVSSDEELDVFDNISEDEADWAPNGTHGIKRSTVVRSGALKSGRLANAVLLSGPHGCGKTATVYAAAKELDFEVFEISPGARRNGKDILEKIGDMTRNHLVQHKQEALSKPEETINEDEVAQEIKSGKQGMMTAFFKPERGAKPPAPKKKAKAATESIKPAADKPTKKLTNSSQKQSLILLEEVDILYEEDKQFWATVIGLMVQSKRPFIMTCNDEALVPIQSLNLHGIFRFTPAPKDQAVDLMLLVAANEGHALQRDAVEALYDSRSRDLRACLAELNYWCQIGVGDPMGGFSWFCRKWPKGSDLDEHGDRLRVVSAGTYHTGMGWFGRDALESPSINRTVEDEAIKQCWESWSLDTGDNSLAMPCDEATKISDLAPADRLAILDEAELFYESLSAADITSCGSFSTLNQVALDCTLPEMPSKARDDFMVGLQPLDAPSLHLYNSDAFELATSIRSLAQGQVTRTELADIIDTYPLDEPRATQKVHDNFSKSHLSTPAISRYDYSVAFDPIAASEKAVVSASGYLDPSVFDRTMKMIALDVAPYVRSIVSYDQRLQAKRLQRSNLLSEGGKPKKRVRTTRSAYSALEGGSRSSVRREKYFAANINPHLVMRTGGSGWEALMLGDHTTEPEHTGPSPQDSSDDMEFSME